MMDRVVMWQAVVYADDTNTPEILPGLHPTSAEAMAQAEAVMDAQPDTHTAAVRRVVLPVNT